MAAGYDAPLLSLYPSARRVRVPRADSEVTFRNSWRVFDSGGMGVDEEDGELMGFGRFEEFASIGFSAGRLPADSEPCQLILNLPVVTRDRDSLEDNCCAPAEVEADALVEPLLTVAEALEEIADVAAASSEVDPLVNANESKLCFMVVGGRGMMLRMSMRMGMGEKPSLYRRRCR